MPGRRRLICACAQREAVRGCGTGGRAKLAPAGGRAVNAGLGARLRGVSGNFVHSSVAAGHAGPACCDHLASMVLPPRGWGLCYLGASVAMPRRGLQPRHGAVPTMSGRAGSAFWCNQENLTSPPQATSCLYLRHCLLTERKKLYPKSALGEVQSEQHCVSCEGRRKKWKETWLEKQVGIFWWWQGAASAIAAVTQARAGLGRPWRSKVLQKQAWFSSVC